MKKNDSNRKVIVIVMLILISPPCIIAAVYTLYTGYNPQRIIVYLMPIIGIDYIRFDFIVRGMTEEEVSKKLGNSVMKLYYWEENQLVSYSSRNGIGKIVPYDSSSGNYIIKYESYRRSKYQVSEKEVKKIKVYQGEEPCIYIYFNYDDKVIHRFVSGS